MVSLETLFAHFPPANDLPAYELIDADSIPSPFRELLVHEHHMTVTMEAYHGDLVDVRLLTRVHQGDSYARKIILTLRESKRIVLFGIVHIDLSVCSPAVRKAIIEAKTPLGRILIDNEVLRRIEPIAFLRVQPGPAALRWFGLERPEPLYGRLAYIHCDNQPAVELLEIVVAKPGGVWQAPTSTGRRAGGCRLSNT
jgi:chorismate-pyruvate lyase